MRKLKLFSLALMAMFSTSLWADYYTPSANEIVYILDGTKLNTHAALTSTTLTYNVTSKKMGDPATALTTRKPMGSNTNGQKIKINNTAKTIQLSIAGCTKVVVCHESHSSRHVKATVTPSGESASTVAGSNSTYFTDIDLDGAKSYVINLEGDNDDLAVYAVVLEKYVPCLETAPAGASITGGDAEYTKGDTYTNLQASATAGTNLNYQWYRNTTNVATVSNDFILENCTTATCAPLSKIGTAYYYCVISNCAGTVTTATAAVTINGNCPLSGEMFAFTMNNEAAPSEQVNVEKNSTLDIDEYLNISNGNAILGTGSSQHAAVYTNPKIKITGNTGYLGVFLDCSLENGDVITISKNSQTIKISDAISGSAPSGVICAPSDKSITSFTVSSTSETTNWVGKNSLYFWYGGSGGVDIFSLTITRPEKYAVTINKQGPGTLAVQKQDGENWVNIGENEKFLQGSTLKVVATPADGGYVCNSLSVLYNDGEQDQEIALDENNQFTMPAYDVTVSASFGWPTGIDNTNANANAIKRIANGVLVIEKNGKIYNAMGQEIR